LKNTSFTSPFTLLILIANVVMQRTKYRRKPTLLSMCSFNKVHCSANVNSVRSLMSASSRLLLSIAVILMAGLTVAVSQTLIGRSVQFFEPGTSYQTFLVPSNSTQVVTITLPSGDGTLLVDKGSGASDAWLLGGNDLSGPADNRLGSTSNNNVIFCVGETAPTNRRLELSSSANAITVTNGGELRFAEPAADGSHYTGFKAKAQATDIVYVLPSLKPQGNQALKVTHVAGDTVALSWANVGGGGTHYVGERYGGGIVFWVDETGNHGLIVSMVNISAGAAWSNVTNAIVGTNDWNGAANTTGILAQAGHTNSAAKICDDYTNGDYGTGVYSDWYLPSRGQLIHIWNNWTAVQNALANYGAPAELIAQYPYWSSTEYAENQAFAVNYKNIWIPNAAKYDAIPYVRAVRSF